MPGWLNLQLHLLIHQDPEKARESLTLFKFLFFTLLSSLGIVLMFAFFRHNSIPNLIVIGLIDFSVVISLVALWFKKIRLASLLYLMCFWISMTFVAVHLHGGLQSPAIEIYLFLIAAAGLLIGKKFGFAFAGLSLLSILGMFFAGQYNLISPGIYPITLGRITFFHILNIILAGVLVKVAIDQIHAGLRKAHVREIDLAAKNRELEEIRASLEQQIVGETARRSLEITRQKQFFEALVQNSPIAIVILDQKHQIVSTNPAFLHLFMYDEGDVIGQELDELITTPEVRSEATHYTQGVLRGEKIRASGKRRRKDGHLVDVEIFGVPVIVGDEQVGILGMYNDITDRKRAEENLEYLATHDSLTHLSNRLLFYDRLCHALTLAVRKQQKVAVFFIDLDGFKKVNDHYGHALGDDLLRAVADRLKRQLRDSDTFARLGGDEFAILLEEILEPVDASIVAQKVLNSLGEPFIVDGCPENISASIGISLYPLDGEDANSLLKNADFAMYRVKEMGKRNYQFFSQ